ncbi:hypothetical protein FWG76_02955, partial [Candidatus Saccharibacteria bacterium]|nr:hypothetical protein [Candidatus Saccharibacteria bacterium]
MNWLIVIIVGVALVLFLLARRNYKKVDKIRQGSTDNVLLLLEIPKNNDKKELAAEQLFAPLHGILRDESELRGGLAQEHLSFEIVSQKGMIQFFVWCPRPLRSFVEGQIYSQYPTVQIKAVDEDYLSHQRDHSVIATTDLVLTDNEALPIKTFDTFDVDPLAGITGTLAKLENTNEELWVQILVRPVNDDWHKKSKEWIAEQKDPKSKFFLGALLDFKWLTGLISALWAPPESGSIMEPTVKAGELSERDKARISAAEEKMGRLGYALKIRLAYLGEERENARLNLQALTGSFKQFNSPQLNGFKSTGIDFNNSLADYRLRAFNDDGFILNIKELASVYHLPNTSVETPNIVWATTRVAEPPAKLP